MEFEWDEDKADLLWRTRRISFFDAANVFRDPDRIEFEDDRRDYREIRRIVTGRSDDRLLTVVYTMRGSTCRLITAWPASRKERRHYGHS